MENLNTVVVSESNVETIENTITLTAHELEDRSINEGSLREKTAAIRKAFKAGAKVKTLAKRYGVSYEWARRIAKNVAYDYDDVTVEMAAEDVAVAVAF